MNALAAQQRGLAPDLLPSTRLKRAINAVELRGMFWVPIFCANCGAPGGLVPENSGFAFYLCDERQKNCAAKWSKLVGCTLIPDDVFFEKVKQTQIEKYGRELAGAEIVEALKDPQHILSKLAKDRPKFG